MAERLKALDGWRAISAGLVVVSHIQGFSGVRFALPISGYGTLGVEYFFGISGFVIARGLLANEGGGYRGFYVRRAFRILPPLLIYLAALICLVILGVLPLSALNAARGLVFACNFPWSNCGGWSVEEQFYLVCPFIILLTKSRRLITGAMIAVPFGALALRFGHLSDAGGFLTSFSVIAAGVACAANEAPLLRIIGRAPAWLVPAAFVATVGVMDLNTKVVTSLLENLVLGPLIMFALLRTACFRGRLNAWLSASWITTLGAATYSIYLFQQLATADYPGAGPVFYAVSVGGCVAWGLLSFRWVERPLIRVGRALAVSLETRGDAVSVAGTGG
jgi:peptidoglycan/LPS O-acetylase OafA/YrhL